MPKVDVIVALKDGKISEIGGYQALIDQNGDFADFLKTYLTEMDDDSADEGMKECVCRCLYNDMQCKVMYCYVMYCYVL